MGPPGSGKSMVAKTVSHEWSIPCLFLEMARIFSQGEGNSERNFRNIIRIAESIAPCVLWIDEMEKAFATG
ncbi:MAG: AAA family ATPase, partial [Gloeobacterales cyanobacterium]